MKVAKKHDININKIYKYDQRQVCDDPASYPSN